MNILLTGGAGYIGSHTYVALVKAGLVPIILDNFSNSRPSVLQRLEQITDRTVVCEKGDVLNTPWLETVLRKHQVIGVIQFAGDKAVSESVSNPLKYYSNNIGGMVSLLRAMQTVKCQMLVFSSSATVYGNPASLPVTEDFPRYHTSPYGHTKLVIEDMLTAMQVSDPSLRVGVLRYFNPAGAHPSGFIGEDPNGIPNNLMPLVAQVAIGKRPFLNVYGSDYDTPDGTAVRDYIHVQDLAQGHVAAIQYLLKNAKSFTVNLGTGYGSSVLEVVKAFELASGVSIPYHLVARRPGDVAQCYADPTLSQHLLGWSARHTLADICSDAWRWQRVSLNSH